MRRAAVILMLLSACAAPAPSPSRPMPASGAPPGPTGAAAGASPGVTPGEEAAWELLPDAPFARLEMAVAAHDGRIWLAGGLSPLGEALTEVDVFDPTTPRWCRTASD
jgi:hypothetical protein